MYFVFRYSFIVRILCDAPIESELDRLGGEKTARALQFEMTSSEFYGFPKRQESANYSLALLQLAFTEFETDSGTLPTPIVIHGPLQSSWQKREEDRKVDIIRAFVWGTAYDRRSNVGILHHFPRRSHQDARR